MRLILKPEWEFDEVVEAAWEVYRSPHQFAGYRINAIKAWGNMIGKRAALQRMHKYISRYKSKKEAAENLGMSYSTLRGIERFYESLPNEFVVFRKPTVDKFIVGETLSIEEDTHNEFKSVTSAKPVRAICDTFTKYALGYLNADGGRIFFGVRDKDAIVEGIELSAEDRDGVRIGLQNKINDIQPKVDPTLFEIEFVKVEGIDEDRYVVVVTVPGSSSSRVYFSASGKCWVRVNGVTQSISGPAIQELIISKQKFYA